MPGRIKILDPALILILPSFERIKGSGQPPPYRGGWPDSLIRRVDRR